MNYLITGAEGFVGQHLTRALISQGKTVRCMTRRAISPGEKQPSQAEYVTGDVTQPSTIARALEGVDVVFHLAGIRRATGIEPFLRVNAEGTRHLAEAMVSHGARRLVLAGSLAACGPSLRERPHVETDDFKPVEAYGQSKADAERIAFSFASKLEVTVMRPCRILGPRDRENLAFFKLAKKGVALKIGGAPRPLSLVDVNDVVEQMVIQATHPQAVGEAFFCASDSTLTLYELMLMVGRRLHTNMHSVYLPEAALSALAACAEFVTHTFHQNLPLNRKLAKQMLAPAWTCSNEKAKRLLGFHPKVSLEESVATSVRSYQEAGWL